jgi:DNA ligase N terminus
MNQDAPVLPFSAICSLLDVLETLLTKYHAPGTKLTKKTFRACQEKEIQSWTQFYKIAITKDSQTTLATLSLLFPYLRRDRVYFLKENTIATALGKALGMGVTGVEKLRDWRLKYGDFGLALEKTLKQRVYVESPC